MDIKISQRKLPNADLNTKPQPSTPTDHNTKNYETSTFFTC